MWNAIQIDPVLCVKSVCEAIKEYKNYGFDCIESFGDPAIHAIMQKSDFNIHLSGSGDTGKQNIWIVVDHLDSCFQEIAKVVSARNIDPIENKEWGYREFGMIDKNGNHLVFAEVCK